MLQLTLYLPVLLLLMSAISYKMIQPRGVLALKMSRGVLHLLMSAISYKMIQPRGVLALEMSEGVHVQNQTLSQFTSWLKRHPVPC